MDISIDFFFDKNNKLNKVFVNFLNLKKSL